MVRECALRIDVRATSEEWLRMITGLLWALAGSTDPR